MNNLLFVYGTLLIPDNKFAIYLNNNARVVGTGKFKGKLYDIGHYPGLVADPEKRHEVTGTIYLLNDAAENFKTLDPYEGFGEGEPKPYLFVRELLKVQTTDGPIDCWVYLYNLPINGLHQITSGNYLDYLSKK